MFLLQFVVTVLSAVTKFLLDADELVVLSQAVCAAHRTSLDLTRVGSNGDVRDCGILSLARTVRSYRGIAMTMSHLDSFEGLSQRTNLVNLDKDRVCCAHLDSLFEELHVGHEQVITYELATITNLSCELHPRVIETRTRKGTETQSDQLANDWKTD